MTEIKTLLLTIISSIVAFLAPISDNIYAMIYFLIANFIVGLLAAILVDGETFRWRKAGCCALEALVFFWLVVSLYIVGHYNGNNESTITAISTIIYAGGWFYTTRILRNIRRMLREGTPFHAFIDFLYSSMSLEFAKKIPGLSKYIEKHQNS